MEIKIRNKRAGSKMRKWHKWAGLILSFFFIMFALSGIFLNHRGLISGIDVPRSYLPSDYSYNNWNNGALKGTLELSPDSILLFGGAGLFITDSLGSKVTHFDNGLKKGADNQIIGNILKTDQGEVYAISTFDLYRLDPNNNWINLSDMLNTNEQISDLQAIGDSLIILTRSHLFISQYPHNKFEKIELKAPMWYKKEASLFRTMWILHSGELFGSPGIVFVDLLGIVSILLCLTGIVFTFFPKIIKRQKTKKKDTTSYTSFWRASIKIHNKLGIVLFVFLFVLILSGTFLRPPLLISIIRTKVSTIPGTILHDDNAWFDKLRCIRYDYTNQTWILYSSEGFYNLKDFKSQPKKLKSPPLVSVMGVTVLEQIDADQWLVGSFSGLYYWSRQTGRSIDAYTLKPIQPSRGGPPLISNAVSGYSSDFQKQEIIFDYNSGVRGLRSNVKFAPTPDYIKHKARMSLWHLCLEIHTGRIYNPVIGIFSDLFIFLSGMLLLSILISGYIVYRRRYRKKKKTKNILNN